jgi:hypothetical protein
MGGSISIASSKTETLDRIINDDISRTETLSFELAKPARQILDEIGLIIDPTNQKVDELPKRLVGRVVGFLQNGDPRPTPRNTVHLHRLHLVAEIPTKGVEVLDLLLHLSDHMMSPKADISTSIVLSSRRSKSVRNVF